MSKPSDKIKLEKKKEFLGDSSPINFAWYGGNLLPNVEITTIFLGPDWQKQPNVGLITKINQFFTDVVKSSYVTQLSEYNADGYSIGVGKFVKTLSVPDALSPNISDVFIQKKIQQLISSKSVGTPNINTLFCVFVDTNSKIWLDGMGSGSDFLGYHNAFAYNTVINYMVIPFPSDSDVTSMGLLNTQDAITAICSHELVESITDPGLNFGWYDVNYGEIGDVSEGNYKTLILSQNWKVQSYYSISRGTHI